MTKNYPHWHVLQLLQCTYCFQSFSSKTTIMKGSIAYQVHQAMYQSSTINMNFLPIGTIGCRDVNITKTNNHQLTCGMCCCSPMVVFLGVVFVLYRWKCSQIIKCPPPNVIINSLNLTSSSPQPFLHRTWKPRCYKTHGKLLPRSHVRSKRIYIKLQCLKLSVMLSSMPLASRHNLAPLWKPSLPQRRLGRLHTSSQNNRKMPILWYL